MPFQIIHTFEGFLSDPPIDGMQTVLRGSEEAPTEELDRVLEMRLSQLQAGGIDGLVVNVGGQDYLESPAGWQLLRHALAVAVRLGFRLWVYDERGYPSGSAGGLTLRDHPEFEAQGIKALRVPAQDGRAEVTFFERGPIIILRCEAVDGEGQAVAIGVDSPGREQLRAWESAKCLTYGTPGLQELRIYYVAALYEGSHAARNYGEKRRYTNLLDSEAVARFITVTHERYARELPADILAHIEAFFTDEPSFMSVVLPPLDGILATPIPVQDETDQRVPILPSLPYSRELQAHLETSYGLNLADIVPQLFAPGDVPSATKCAFWEAAAQVYGRAFASQLAAACARLGKKLTGHILFEESPFENMVFHANPFAVLKPFQLPGVDLLSNTLSKISVFGHKLPFSAAFLTGKRGIMTETSDFVESMMQRKAPVGAEVMSAALCLQYLLGVREFSYYYDYRVRDTGDYSRVNRMVSRTCAYGADLAYTLEAALYCSYETFWAGYVPSATLLRDLLLEQPSYLQQAQEQTLRLCNELFERNVQFVLCDATSVAQAIAQGIKRVFLPAGRVVAEDLVQAALRGDIELYGATPEYVYAHGQLLPVTGLTVHAETDFLAAKMPFQYDEGLLISALGGRRFYCFNPTARQVAIRPDRSAFVYDPFANSGKTIAQGKPFRLSSGHAVFVTA
jgi:hypothetical protein